MINEHSHLESLYPDNCRFSEIDQIVHFVKEGYSCEMIAIPGVGRSNVCKFLCFNRNIRVKHLGKSQISFHFVFVNFAEIKNRPLLDAIKYIFLEIVESLHERRFEEAFATTDKIFKEALSYQDELVLFQGLKRALDFLVHEKNLHIVLLFERFEMYIPMLTDDFFVRLRSLRDSAKYKFSVVFSTTRPLEDVLEPAMMADFYEFFGGKLVYLTLTDLPGIKYRIQYLEKLTEKQLGEETIQNLLMLTGGHGKLTRLGTEALLASPLVIASEQSERGNLKKEGITSSHTPRNDKLENFFLSEKTIQAALNEIWDFLTPFDKRCLLQICGDQACDNPLLLTQMNLLAEGKVTIPLLAIYLEKKNTTLKQDPITYDTRVHVIKKGQQIISEQLTSYEFQLLQFLLENPDKILTREEIIAAVWKDVATTAGVTDQALDQLLFRLRKKIEDNPNKPAHIQTIKGRGIRFMQ